MSELDSNTLTQEFDAEGRHRILCNGIPVTRFAGYRQYTFYRGFVGCTAYYLDKEAILPAAEFCRITGVTEE